jgi:hypothetical protein
MEFELWWLLAFPLFFVLGWLAARIDIKHVVKESRALPRTYLTGLNFLLNEQPDKAIDAFIEAVKIDNQTVELHFALGSLFRRRGETDRAIRMHQNLIDREDLSDEQRQQALSELGLDFSRPACSIGPRRSSSSCAAPASTISPSTTSSTSISRRRTGRRPSRSPRRCPTTRACCGKRRWPTSTASWRLRRWPTPASTRRWRLAGPSS